MEKVSLEYKYTNIKNNDRNLKVKPTFTSNKGINNEVLIYNVKKYIVVNKPPCNQDSSKILR